MNMILIQSGQIYQPDARGKGDILIGGGRILAIEENIDPAGLPGGVEILSADDCPVTPGFVDGHQHFTGGGGEGGFHTRAPEMQLSVNIRCGVTTAVGLLGTDSLTRSVENLYAKTQALAADGMTTRMLTGAYWHPSPTITGTVARDLVYIDPVIGVKLALADHRGPHIEAKELATLAADVRVAALVADKPGVITVHTGVLPERLDLIFEVVDRFGIRPDMFIPTHINREDAVLTEQVFELARRGAMVDATCVPADRAGFSSALKVTAADFAVRAEALGLFEQVTFSSDAGGSIPRWNDDRSRITGMAVATPASLHDELVRLVQENGIPLERALSPLTRTPAKVYGLAGSKGEIREGADADLLVLHPETLAIRDVVARGRVMMRGGEIRRGGYFESGAA